VNYRIKENSFLAYIARKVLKANGVAMVLGNTIHLNGVKSVDFLKDVKWVKHELVHIDQFKRYGFFKFLALYFFESCRNGYYNNKFEVEARRGAEAGD
jgi:hypothetical protein